MSKQKTKMNFEQGLEALVAEKIVFGETLINSLLRFNAIDGVQKLQRKIKQELNFLRKIYKSESIKKEHLQCSNLTHFTAVIETLGEVVDCVSVNKIFYLEDRKLTVDIVCNKGLFWYKVVARNPKSLSQISMGDASFGVKSILDQADEFVKCAELHPCLFQIPKIVFVFTNGIEQELANQLEQRGVTVYGTKLDSLNVENKSLPNFTPKSNIIRNNLVSELSTKNSSCITKVNLDVSAMLAYVSSVTNGSSKLYEFCVPVLQQQALWESERPQKPILDSFFEGKKLYCCETARNSFEEIVNTVGGPNEKLRAKDFLQRITVLSDNATASDTEEGVGNSEMFSNIQFTSNKVLQLGGKIRERSLIIFTFGDRIQAVTVTANDGFVRAAKQQGINFVVFVHESRALTEQKEFTKALKVGITS